MTGDRKKRVSRRNPFSTHAIKRRLPLGSSIFIDFCQDIFDTIY
ncbi:hypothetical protein VL20_2076 [Microcystis panniformis FACHB-1757]|uniref:Uncharacterized protein n=1 Tax=Microcystis panniformis FACHB-1757 TaxID=1638788 RepID=A0A0K1RZJ8_9CHRO|nr:hypothetical protein VL20_2076 [Microcystis panniformis FACHB-1757]